MIYKKISLTRLFDYLVMAALVVTPTTFAMFRENFSVFELNKQFFFHLFVWSILCVLIWQALSTSKLVIPKNRGWYYWLAVLAIAALNPFISLSPMYSLIGNYARQQGMYTLYFYLIFGALVACLGRDRQTLERWVVAAAFGSLPTVFYGVLQIMHLDPMRWAGDTDRIFSSFGQTNIFAQYLVIVLPLSFFAYFKIKSKPAKILLVTLILGQLACILETYSRGAWIALVVVILISLAAYTFLFKKFRKFLLAVLIIGSIFIGYSFKTADYWMAHSSNSVVYRYFSIFNTQIGSNRMRREYIEAVVKDIKTTTWPRRLLGYGKDCQETRFMGYYKKEWGVYEALNSFPDRAHNLILDLYLEFGLLGVLFFTGLPLVAIVTSFKKAIKGDKRDKNIFIALLGAITGYGVAGLFSFPLTTQYVYYYFLIGCLLAFGANGVWEISFDRLTPIFKKTFPYLLVACAVMAMLTFNLRYFIADHYYIKAKTNEVMHDCQNMLDNYEYVLAWFPEQVIYRSQYIFAYNNCINSISNKAAIQQAFSNTLDVVDGFSAKEKNIFKIKTDIAHAYSMLGYFDDKKYYDQAAEAYEDMIKVAPNVSSSYQDYGRMEMWRGDLRKAIKIFDECLSVTPDLNSSNMNGDHLAAVSEQRRFVYSLMCDCYKDLHYYDKALDYCMQAEKINSTMPDVKKSIVDIHKAAKNWSKAIEYAIAGRNLDPENYEWRLTLADLYKQSGDKKKALDSAKQAKKLAPDNKKVDKMIEELSK